MQLKTFISLFLCPFWLFAQLDFPQIKIHRVSTEIKVDGLLDEEAWAMAEKADKFKMNYPIDTMYSPWQTEARICFDENNLYFGIRCYEKKSDYIIQSLKRDFDGGTTDVINVIIDPFKDGLNGLIFSVSPLNVQREGNVIEGNDLNFIWDNKWVSKVKNYEEYWDVEIAIPFKTLRYKLADIGKENHWGLNFLRTKLKSFETSTWAPIPAIYDPVSLGFAGDLLWIDPPPNSGKNISFIPYINVGSSQDYIRDAQNKLVSNRLKLTKNIGADGKIAITPGLNLDLTINPDFSQVEVDKQIANVSRFELFFPETRQFFIENQDLFGRFGFPSTRPFFSRRLGIAYNPNTSSNVQVPILGGIRLSGKLSNNLRIGLLNMTSQEKRWDSIQVLPGHNSSVFTLQHKIFARSTISGIYVDKENFLNKLKSTESKNFETYNRVAGLEYNLFSKDNKWEGEAYFHRSFSPNKSKEGSSFASFLSYNIKKIEVRLGFLCVDSFYSADLGFVPRTGIKEVITGVNYNIWPKNSMHIRNYSIGLNSNSNYNLTWNPLDYNINLNTGIQFVDQAYIGIGANYDFINLYNTFDPTGGLIDKNEQALPIGKYYARSIQFNSNTGNSNKIQGNLDIVVGEYFKGSKFNISGLLKYRIQPYGVVSISYDYYHIRQNKPFPSADFFLVGPRAEISMRKDLFLSGFFQYNTQINNFNINTRLQWRFAPVSDIFLVFTNNSFAQAEDPNIKFLATKNRALVLKAVYWFN